jgi:Putative manganese efflux pump
MVTKGRTCRDDSVLLKLVAFVIPLGFDTLAVATALGLRGMRPLRPALTFAFFEALMPLIGLLLGRLVGERFETPAIVLGGVVLLVVALHMLREALEEEDETERLSFACVSHGGFRRFRHLHGRVSHWLPNGRKWFARPRDDQCNSGSSFYRYLHRHPCGQTTR